MPPQEEIAQLKTQVKELELENKTLKQSVEYLTKKLYGRSSEKTEAILPEQLNLFNEAEICANPKAKEPDLQEVAAYRRKRYPGQKEELLKDIPHEKRLCTLPEGERRCKDCGNELVPVGQEFVRTEVEFIPAKLRVIDFYRETFECRSCRKNGQPYMNKASVPAQVLPHSIASASSVAWVMHQKYVNAMPLNRQEQEWHSIGLALSRATMSNWIIGAVRDWLSPLADLLHREMLRQNYLHADETTVQVLQEEGRRNTTVSYMWVYATGKSSEKPVRLFEYRPGRSGDYPREFLKGFRGYLHTDGYAGYEKVKGVRRCCCWSHVRRKFVDALPADVKSAEATLPAEGIRQCNQLFDIEKTLDQLPPEKRKEERLKQEKPVLDAFLLWLDSVSVDIPPKGKLAEAIRYTCSLWEGLTTYLEDGNCAISNNLDENCIRPFTVGRKNWLFCGSPKGAASSATVYSLTETAKANGLDTYKYLLYILKNLPAEDFHRQPERLEKYLPWDEDIRQLCM